MPMAYDPDDRAQEDHVVLTLYHQWSSVCSQKVRFVLAEKGLAWESRHVDLFKFENWEPDYIKLNPRGVVPTLDHDGRVVVDSNIIVEYLEDAYAEAPLRPDDAHGRAIMRHWMKMADDIAHPSVVQASYNLRHLPRFSKLSEEELVAIAARHPDPDLRKQWLRKFKDGVSADEEGASYDRLERLVQRMEEGLAQGPWLAGADLTLADIALAPYVNRIEVLAHPEVLAPGARPRLAAWWERIQERPAYIEAFSFASPDPDDPIKR